MSTFTCRSCRNDIPLSASKCMYCHEDPHEWPDGQGTLSQLWDFAKGFFLLWIIYEIIVFIW